MFELRYESVFRDDFKRVMRRYPQLLEEFKAAVTELVANGSVSEAYHPHLLTKAGGAYTGHMDFHLSDGAIDVVVLYVPHKSNPSIRFVRMGTHEELFFGRVK